MKQMVYLIAFGAESLEQFALCLSTIRQCAPVDIVLLTDQDYHNKDVTVGRVKPPVPPPNADGDPAKAQYHAYFTYRTRIHQLINLAAWEQVWYMDTDFILKDDLFAKYADSPHTLLCKEPGTYISNEHFCGAMTAREISDNPYLRGINAGIYAVPRSQVGFFPWYHDAVERMIKTSERAWLTEQHVLNMAYVRFRERFNIKTFEDGDVGFPQKKTTGMALHYACYTFKDKIKLMRHEIAYGAAGD